MARAIWQRAGVDDERTRRRVIHPADDREPFPPGSQGLPAGERQAAHLPFLMLNRQLEVIASNQHDRGAGIEGPDDGISAVAAELASRTGELRAHVERILEDGDPDPRALEWRDGGGRLHSLLFTAIRPDADGRNVPPFILIADLTRQLAATRSLADLVQQQRLKLREMRHRMANGLQVIASILRIKTHLSRSTEVRAYLEDVHRRVLSIAALEEQLDPSEGVESNWVKPYLSAVCDRLAGSFIDPGKGVELRVVSADMQLRADMIVSIGLVVTELVINAMKHAFAGEQGGTIIVMLTGEEASWTLSVTDSGAGCRSEALQSSSGLGTRIIRALARRLNAQLDISPNEPSGLRVVLTHPRRPTDPIGKPA